MSKKKAKKTKKSSYQLNALPCKFSNLTAGPAKCAIGVTIDRTAVPLAKLESMVVDACLDTELLVDPNGQHDVPGQLKVGDVSEMRIQTIAQCSSLSVRPDKYGFRLTFSAKEVSVKELAAIAQMIGAISLARIGNSDSMKSEAQS